MRWLLACLLLCPAAGFAAISMGVVPVSTAPSITAVPYTGFNSFYAQGGVPTQTYMTATSDFLISSGLQAAWTAHGGAVVAAIDEHWTTEPGNVIGRDGSGHPIPSGNFSSIPTLVAHIKANSQIPGIYRDSGRFGCGNEDWGAGTLNGDLTYFFQTLGFQLIKLDVCGLFVGSVGAPLASARAVSTAAYSLIGGFGVPFIETFGGGQTQDTDWSYFQYGGNAYRIASDVGSPPCVSSFTNLITEIHGAAPHPGVVGPGHFIDMDYLQANNNGTGGSLTTDEALSQMGMNAVMGSPWVVGCDPQNLGTTELATLKNADLLSILQDPWVNGGWRIDGALGPPTYETYARRLSGTGNRAIVVINENASAAQTVVVDPALIGIDTSQTYTYKDVFTGTTTTGHTGTFTTASFPGHASKVYLISAGTENNATCWATNPGGTGQIADGFPSGCAFATDNNGFPYAFGVLDGTTVSTGTAISTAGLTNPAAQGCYQKQRKGVIATDDPNVASVEYLAPNLVAGATYHYRVHLAEIEGQTAGQRLFNLNINAGTQSFAALSSHDIFTSAGGANKAEIIEGNIVADHGYLSFDFEPIATPTGVPTTGCIEVIKQ